MNKDLKGVLAGSERGFSAFKKQPTWIINKLLHQDITACPEDIKGFTRTFRAHIATAYLIPRELKFLLDIKHKTLNIRC